MAMQRQHRQHLGPVVYYIELEVLSARDLPSKDIGGGSDPFVRVMVGGEERTTKAIKKCLNPQWKDSKFSFKFFAEPKEIAFVVMDQDLGSDDKIGSAELSLCDLFAVGPGAEPFRGPLALRNGRKTKGSLTVKVSAQKLVPLEAAKVAAERQEALSRQRQQMEALTLEISSLRQQNASLRRRAESAEAQNSGAQSFCSRPTRRRKNIEGATKWDEVAAVRLLMANVVALWQWVLRHCVYGLPLFGIWADSFVLFLGSALRLFLGRSVLSGAAESKRPRKLLKLYEFEGDIECKMVRETLSALDLDCVIFPCPPGRDESRSRFIGDAQELCGGTARFPLLVDENGDDGPSVALGADHITTHLMQHYGDSVTMTTAERARAAVASHWTARALHKVLYQGVLRSAPEFGNERNGATVKPKEPLELWGFEASPFCRAVRETLTTLELPYVLRNVAVGSTQKRVEFRSRFGGKYPEWRQRLNLIQVPLVIDPNTGTELFESRRIKKYLVDTYCTHCTV